VLDLLGAMLIFFPNVALSASWLARSHAGTKVTARAVVLHRQCTRLPSPWVHQQQHLRPIFFLNQS